MSIALRAYFKTGVAYWTLAYDRTIALAICEAIDEECGQLKMRDIDGKVCWWPWRQLSLSDVYPLLLGVNRDRQAQDLRDRWACEDQNEDDRTQAFLEARSANTHTHTHTHTRTQGGGAADREAA